MLTKPADFRVRRVAEFRVRDRNGPPPEIIEEGGYSLLAELPRQKNILILPTLFESNRNCAYRQRSATSNMSKLLTVVGATGQQGGSLIEYILQHAELCEVYTLRGVTHDATKPTAVALQGKGVEIVQVRRSGGSCPPGLF